MSSIKYSIDKFTVYKRFLLVEGWAFTSKNDEFLDIIAIGSGIEIYGVTDRVDRPDVLAYYSNAVTKSGFSLRVIIPTNVNIMEIGICFQSLSERLLVEKPWLKLVSDAYAPLEKLNKSFFDAVKATDCPTVLEIGARARSGITRKSLFGEKAKYCGFDIKPGENVDIVGDAHLLSSYFDRSSIEFAFSVSVFEHLMWPWKVAIELGKVMKVDGLILMQSHPVWPKHEMPWDFFRFWDSGWRALFCRETGFEVIETVEAHEVDLVASPFTGSYVHHWENSGSTLASSVLARKISEPTVEWQATPRFEVLGLYPG